MLGSDPQTALFRYSSLLINYSNSMQMPVVYGMVIAKKVIFKLWKTDKVSQSKMWLTELTEILYMERLWDDTLIFLQYTNSLLVSLHFSGTFIDR